MSASEQPTPPGVPLVVEFDATDAEYQAYTAHSTATVLTPLRRAVVTVGTLGPLSLVVLYALVIAEPAAIVGAVLVVAAFFVASSVTGSRQRTFIEPMLGGRITLHDWGVRHERPGQRSDMAWSIVTRVQDDDIGLILDIAPGQVLLLPERAVDTATWIRVVHEVRAHVMAT